MDSRLLHILETASLHDLKTFDDKWLMRLDNDKFLTLFFFVYKGLPGEVESSEEQQQQQQRPMSFVNDPGDESRGTEFPHSNAEQAKVEVTTPQKISGSKRNRKKAGSNRKKRKRKQTTPKKSDEAEEEIMSKLIAVKQQREPRMLMIANLSNEAGQKSRWDVSAQTLLNMTLTFLRHVPEVSSVN